jgi:hypothetical protein
VVRDLTTRLKSAVGWRARIGTPRDSCRLVTSLPAVTAHGQNKQLTLQK